LITAAASFVGKTSGSPAFASSAFIKVIVFPLRYALVLTILNLCTTLLAYESGGYVAANWQLTDQILCVQ